MSYCLNSVCPSPQNADDAQVCQCGTKLRLNDRYMTLKPIGQGGFGRTFLAVDWVEMGKPRCVVKQFFPNWGIDRAKASQLFREEAERLKQLDEHPQIPNLLGYLEQDDQQYLIQEFIDGQNLEQELAAQGAFNQNQIRQLLLDLLPVLQFMHDRQVIHRDIKPANIIRRAADRKLVLVDLGAAKSATGTALAKTGTVIGSAEYTAPEQARGRAVFASDIYSLGATCIHLLTQISPFDLFDTSDDRWMWRDYLDQPVNQRLDRILNKMLENGTNRRYQTVTQVLADLNSTTQLSLKITAPVEDRPTTQSSSSNRYFDRTDELIGGDDEAQTASKHPDLKFEQAGEIVTDEERGRFQLEDKKWAKPSSRNWFTWFTLVFCAYGIGLGMVIADDQRAQSPVVSPSPVFSTPTVVDPPGIRTQTIKIGYPLEGVVISPSGEILAELKGSTIRVWGLATGRLIHEFPNPIAEQTGVLGIAIGSTSGGEQLAIETDQGLIALINLQTGQLVKTINLINELGSFSMGSLIRIDSSGQTLIRNSVLDGKTSLWNLQTGRLIRELETTGTLLDSDGETFTIENQANSTLSRLDARTGRQMHSLPLPSELKEFDLFRVSANGQILLTASDSTQTSEGFIFTVWSVETGAKLGQFTQAIQSLFPLPIALSPDGRWMAIVDGAQLQLRNLETGEIVRFTQSLPDTVSVLRFGLDGRTLIAVCTNGTIVVRSLSQ
ncbi:MAG: protein kinase [Leptolyngbyaceae cyanobacterium SM1_3_5]|nr:protein kinase [Leptolyngbyaceae cyanobacterium SM1_3_5]